MKPFTKLKLKNQKQYKHFKKEETQPVIEEIFKCNLKVKDLITEYQPFEGYGLIVTSGKTVHGFDTKFKEQIEKGDLIMVQNPLLKTMEQRTVLLVLGDKSILLQEGFIQEFSSATPYFIQKKSKVEKGEDLNEDYKKKMQQIHKSKLIKKSTMDVRVKKGTWSYQKKKVEVDPNLTKEQLLDIRQKMGKDKFCW